MNVERSSSIDHLREAGWDRLAGAADFYSSTDWLGFADAAMQGEPVYLLGRSGGCRLVSGLACYVFRPEAAFPPQARIDRVLRHALWPQRTSRVEHLRRTEALSRLLPNLCCGGRQLADTRLLFAGGGPDTRRQALSGMLAAAERLAHDAGAASVSFNCVEARDRELREELRARGFFEFASRRRCLLAIDWDGFDGYLARFHHERRRSIRRELRRLHERGVRFQARPLAEMPLQVLAELERNLLRRHGVRRSRAQVQASLRQLAERFAERGLVATGDLRGELIGFALFLRWRDQLYGRHAGFDYRRQADLPLYFGLTLYFPAALAPALGIRAIDYGFGSVETKASRGCQVIDQFGYVKCTLPGRQRELAALLAAHEPAPV